MSSSDWLALFTICVLGAYSPGPSQAMILSCVAKHGKPAGLRAAAGHGFGVLLYAIASATGLSVLLLTHRWLFSFAQLAGAALLLFIAFGLFCETLRPSDEPVKQQHQQSSYVLLRSFRDGFLIAIFNPKIAIFFLSLFSQFLSPGQTPVTHILMGFLAGIIDTFAYLSIVMIASLSSVNLILSRHERSRNLAFGLLLSLVAISMVTSFI